MKLKEIIVVEGKHDSQRLKGFFDVDTIETSGMYLSKERLEQIKLANEKRGVVLFLDPDAPGEKIRRRINDYIPNLKNAFIDAKLCRTTKKVGIEHASKEDLEKALSNSITFGDMTPSLKYEDFLDLGLNGEANSSLLREKIGERLFLGKCNAKTLYKRLNMYQISKEDLAQIIKEIYG